MNPNSRLAYFPISFFATVMGLSGLCIAWESAELTFGLPFRLEGALLPFTALISAPHRSDFLGALRIAGHMRVKPSNACFSRYLMLNNLQRCH